MPNLDDYSATQIEHTIDEWIHHERNRMIARRFLDGCRICDIAEAFELSETQTKNIIYQCKTQIIKHI